MVEQKKRRLIQLFNMEKADIFIDDITNNDFDLDSIFEKINFTSSSIGEEVLYKMLRTPLMSKEALNERIEAIKTLEKDSVRCEKLIKQLNSLPKLNKISVFEYLKSISSVKIPAYFSLLLHPLLMLLSFAFLFINPVFGIISICIIYFYNASMYFKKKDQITPYYICLSYLSTMVRKASSLSEINEMNLKKASFLKYSSFLIGITSGETANAGSGNPLDVLLSFFKMGFHIDIIRFYSLVGKVNANYQNIYELIYEIGLLDAYVSIISYKNSLDYYCIPSFTDEEKTICLLEGVHPLLNNARPNSIVSSRGVLLTGSNASGKSTFLRMIGINTILAQSICIVLAKKYEAPIYRVFSSMSIKDNLNDNDSFYIAEIKAIKRILDKAVEPIQCLCFFDELLKGTNTKERIAASSTILKCISKNSLVFAATHDSELTEILSDCFENYHFNEEIINDDYEFDYALKKGPCESTNAIRLLEKMNFPLNITEGARELLTLNLANDIL